MGPAQPDQAPPQFDFLSNTSSSSSFVESPISSWQAPTLPMPSFGPPTPTVADFAAAERERERERSRPRTISVASVSANSASYSRETIVPPGFSGMLSPRSSSPMPPPAVDVDVAMAESGAVANDRSLSSIERTTDSLRDSLTRARALERDRRMAPLRIDAALDNTGRVSRSTSRDTSRPHIPPFDFEAFRRRDHPAQQTSSSFDDTNHLTMPTGPLSPGYRASTCLFSDLAVER